MTVGECESTKAVFDGLAAFTRAAALNELRTKRAQSVRAALCEFENTEFPARDLEFPEDFAPDHVVRALLEHRLQAAQWFAEARDADRWREMLQRNSPLSNWRLTGSNPSTGLSVANFTNPSRRVGDAPAYLVGTCTTRAPTGFHLELATRSLANARFVGFGSLVDAVGLVVFVRHRDLLGQSNSWTTTALPGTIYTDFTDYSDALTVELVHEAAHLWLNDAFRSRGFPRATRESFQSPWKDAPRKAFGFAHAVFAFSCVTIFAREFLRKAPDTPGKMFLERIYDRERERLNAVSTNVPRALRYVEQDIARVIDLAYLSAIAAHD